MTRGKEDGRGEHIPAVHRKYGKLKGLYGCGGVASNESHVSTGSLMFEKRRATAIMSRLDEVPLPRDGRKWLPGIVWPADERLCVPT